MGLCMRVLKPAVNTLYLCRTEYSQIFLSLRAILPRLSSLMLTLALPFNFSHSKEYMNTLPLF